MKLVRSIWRRIFPKHSWTYWSKGPYDYRYCPCCDRTQSSEFDYTAWGPVWIDTKRRLPPKKK